MSTWRMRACPHGTPSQWKSRRKHACMHSVNGGHKGLSPCALGLRPPPKELNSRPRAPLLKKTRRLSLSLSPPFWKWVASLFLSSLPQMGSPLLSSKWTTLSSLSYFMSWPTPSPHKLVKMVITSLKGLASMVTRLSDISLAGPKVNHSKFRLTPKLLHVGPHLLHVS